MLEQTKVELAAAAAADLALSTAETLANEMQELHEVELGAVAQRLRRLDVFERLEGYTDDGHITAAAWVRNKHGKSHSVASSEVSVARVRRTCPRLAECFDTGRTSFRHLQIVVAAMRRLAKPEIWMQLDEKLSEWAQEIPVAGFAHMLEELIDQLLPEPKSKDEKQRDRRRLAVTVGYDGMVDVTGRLTPEVGEKLNAALSAASRPDAADETRTPGQRKADGLENVLDTVLDTALLPIDGGEKPHLTLSVNLDQLAGEPEHGEPGPLWRQQGERDLVAAAAAAEAINDQPRYYWTGPAGPSAARRLSCDGILLPIFTRGGQTLDVGRRTRVVNASTRAFIAARDRHCQWPGCELGARWCQVHHVQHWRDGGRTDRYNLILICEAHHHAAHSGRWTVTLHAPGRITVRERRTGDPYYEILEPDPPPPESLLVDELLATAARHLQATA